MSDAPPPALRRRLAAAGLVPSRARWSRLAGGRTSSVFLASGHGGAVVCKLARPDAGSLLFPVAPAAEALAMTALAPCGLAPALLGRLAYGRHQALIYAHLPGRQARTPAAGLAVLLHRLHSLPAPRRPKLPRRPAFAPALIARACAHLHAAGWPAPALAGLAARARQADLCTVRPCHGDPVPANVLEAADGHMLIDWQCAHLGDPARDLALAVSPAMHVAYGRPAPAAGALAAFRAAYPCPGTAARAARLAPVFHLQMIGHCLWRIERARSARAAALDRAALAAETAALAAETVRD